MSSPENSAAAIMLTIAPLLRIAAAHFSNPDRALAFAVWCEKEAGVHVDTPAGREDKAGRAWEGKKRVGPARPPLARCSVAFNGDPWEAWR